MVRNNTRVLLALKDHAFENRIDSYTIRCIPEIEMVLGIAPCWLVATLTEEGMISGCEGDVLSTLTMQIQYLLSDKKPFMFDIISIDGPDDSFLIWHCGAAAPSLSGERERVVFGHSSILKNNDDPVGLCTNFIPARGKINVCQLTEDWKTGGYRVFTLDGEAVETNNFMPGGTPLRIKLGVNSRKLGSFIIDRHLPHHFCLNHSVLSKHVKEICLWKNIDLIEP
jgi:L-fucose isomerase-like protein